jgi:hypothetical protein
VAWNCQPVNDGAIKADVTVVLVLVLVLVVVVVVVVVGEPPTDCHAASISSNAELEMFTSPDPSELTTCNPHLAFSTEE